MTTINDDFNRIDEDPIASPWFNVGRGAMSLLSHVIEGFNTATSGDHCVRRQETVGADQYAQVRIKTIDAGGACNGVSVRCSSTQNTYYGLLVSNTDWFITKVVNDGAPSVLATGAVTAAINDTIYLSVSGTSPAALTAKLNTTTLGTYNDNSSPITSGFVGMAQSGDTSGRSQDLFQGGDLGGGETVTMDKWYQPTQQPRMSNKPNSILAYMTSMAQPVAVVPPPPISFWVICS